MSLEWAEKVETNVQRALRVAKSLVPPGGETLWAILDGASIPRLPLQLHEHRPVHACLLQGALKPDLAETAPYLVEIKPPGGITTRVLGEGWGRHWGIFLTSKAPLDRLLVHFRGLQTVRLPSGKTAWFRFYDPRVLKVFLPTCDQVQAEGLFGPATQFLLEGDEGKSVIRCQKSRTPLTLETRAI